LLSLEERDTTTSPSTLQLAEDSRPHRQFKEDGRAKRGPSGRKRQNIQGNARYVNWLSPFLWNQIETATRRAGKPWSPGAIVKEAKRLNPTAFATLTPQVVGWWIDSDAKKCGKSRWTKTVLDRVKEGNSPGGQTTQIGILVSQI